MNGLDHTPIHYNPNPSSLHIHNSLAKTKVIVGPVGSGKTSVACWEFYQMCVVSKVPIRGLVIRESYRELMDSTRHTWEEWFGDIATFKEGDKESYITLTGLDGETRTHMLAFRSCRKESDVSKFLSTEYAFIWLEEVVPAYSKKGVMGQGLPKGVFDTAQMRVRQKGAPYLEVLVTCNPPNTRHWVYTEFFLKSPFELSQKRIALFRQPAMENEGNLPEHYYQDLMDILPPDLARRFVGGEVVPIYDGVRVFPECEDNYHIVEHLDPIPGVPLVIGQDYGHTPCALITQITPHGEWRWLRELQLWNSSMQQYLEFLVPLLRNEFSGFDVRCIWQDPQGGNQRSQVDFTTCASLLRDAGFVVQDGKNDWSLRKELIKQRFAYNPNGKPSVQISRYGCQLSAEALLGGYRYPRSSEGVVGTTPIKNEFSHLMDCAQMIATGEFQPQIAMGYARQQQEAARRPSWNPLSSNPQPTPTKYGWLTR